jgi:hypothetical protein
MATFRDISDKTAYRANLRAEASENAVYPNVLLSHFSPTATSSGSP